MTTETLQSSFRPHPKRLSWYRGQSQVELSDGVEPLFSTEKMRTYRRNEISPDWKVVRRGSTNKAESQISFGVDRTLYKSQNQLPNPRVVYSKVSLPLTTTSKVGLAPNTTARSDRSTAADYLSSTARAYRGATPESYVPQARIQWYRGKSTVPLCGPRTFPLQEWLPPGSPDRQRPERQGGMTQEDMTLTWPGVRHGGATRPMRHGESQPSGFFTGAEPTPNSHARDTFPPHRIHDASPPRTLRGSVPKTASQVHDCMLETQDQQAPALPRGVEAAQKAKAPAAAPGQFSTTTGDAHSNKGPQKGPGNTYRGLTYISNVHFGAVNPLADARARLRTMGKA